MFVSNSFLSVMPKSANGKLNPKPFLQAAGKGKLGAIVKFIIAWNDSCKKMTKLKGCYYVLCHKHLEDFSKIINSDLYRKTFFLSDRFNVLLDEKKNSLPRERCFKLSSKDIMIKQEKKVMQLISTLIFNMKCTLLPKEFCKKRFLTKQEFKKLESHIKQFKKMNASLVKEIAGTSKGFKKTFSPFMRSLGNAVDALYKKTKKEMPLVYHPLLRKFRLHGERALSLIIRCKKCIEANRFFDMQKCASVRGKMYALYSSSQKIKVKEFIGVKRIITPVWLSLEQVCGLSIMVKKCG